ncbi:hypothetical protein ACFE04_016313 [Oxalis oulophora]
MPLSFEDKEHDDWDEDLDFRAVENRFVSVTPLSTHSNVESNTVSEAIQSLFVVIDRSRRNMAFGGRSSEFLQRNGRLWTLGYKKASLEKLKNVFFISYEELKGDARTRVKRLAEFIGYPRRWSRKGSRDNQELYLKTIKQ